MSNKNCNFSKFRINISGKRNYSLRGKAGKYVSNSISIFLEPLSLRAVTIHGDGTFFIDNKKNSIQAEWYQLGDNIKYMQKLLNKVIPNNPILSRTKSKKDNVYSITIPSCLVRLVCRSLNLEIRDFHSIEFFKTISKLPNEYKMQVFLQFLVDEAHLKCTTLTVSQKKKWSRRGLKILLDSLNFDYPKPTNDKQDIIIYNYNFPKILKYIDEAKNRYGNLAGLWFKEKDFIDACKKINPNRYPIIRKSTKINKKIFIKLKKSKVTFGYQDIKDFGRTHSQANKAIRNWKKNKLIRRIDLDKYKIL